MTWSGTHDRSGCVAGAIAGLSGGTIVVALSALVVSLRPLILFLVIGIFVAGFALISALVGRQEIHTAEFTRGQVLLVSSVASRTVEIDDLTEVAVKHSGDTDTGYARTSLRLRWRGGESGVTLVGEFNPELVRSLGRVLGPGHHVKETWEELEPPPASA